MSNIMTEKTTKPPKNTLPTPEEAVKEKWCSFCGKSSKNAHLMIAGPDNIFICDACVDLCLKILVQESDAPLWIPVSPQHNVFAEYLGTKRNFPAVKIIDRGWHIAYLAPHHKEFDAIFSTQIAPLAARYSLDIIRLPPVYGKRKSISGIIKNVYEAVILIADVSGKESDVLYVLGMAHLIGKPLILLSQDPADIPIDLKKDRQILYEHSKEGLKIIGHYLSPVFAFVSHEKKADALLPYEDKLYDPMNYPDPPMPKQRRIKK
jgi:hypothetical protein